LRAAGICRKTKFLGGLRKPSTSRANTFAPLPLRLKFLTTLDLPDRKVSAVARLYAICFSRSASIFIGTLPGFQKFRYLCATWLKFALLPVADKVPNGNRFG